MIGVDASADRLRETSRRLAAKPSRGGLPNAHLGVMALEQAPGALAGLASSVSVLLPWGSLLRAIACADPEGLTRLRGLARDGADLRIVFGHGDADATARRDHGLPDLDDDDALADLVAGYRRVGLAIDARPIDRREVGELDTTWAKKLAFSGNVRRFVELRGRAIEAPGAQGTGSPDPNA
ncbi:MAG: hypothetical protein R3B09_10750 [Nannocystaceae bacterium]